MFVDNDTVYKNHIIKFFISLGVLNEPKLRYIWRKNFMFVAFQVKSSQFLIELKWTCILSHLTKVPRRCTPSKLNIDTHHTITESHKFSRVSVFKVDIHSRNKWIEFTKARCTPRNKRSFIIEPYSRISFESFATCWRQMNRRSSLCLKGEVALVNAEFSFVCSETV